MDLSVQGREKIVNKFIENADVLLMYFDQNGNVSICNRKLELITASKKDEILGKNWLNVLYRNSDNTIKQQMFKAVMEDSITYKRPNNFEGMISDKDNKERRISWRITPILAESKELDGVLLVGNDITELKQREASFKKIDETLKNIFASIKEYALYVINLEGNITYYGMGSESLFGWPKDEIIFKHASIFHTRTEGDFDLSLILAEVNRCGRHETELELIKKDGTAFPVTLTATKFLDHELKPIGYIFIVKDITERRKLEYQIFQAEKLAAIGRLAAGMAHEINNPLFVISGRLDLLLEGANIDENVRKDLGIISQQADRIRKLVDRLLMFSRQKPPVLENIDINDSLEGVLPLLSYHKLPSESVTVEKRFAAGLPPVKGDLNQLQEVFVNLMLNAYQSMPNGGTLSIKTENLEDKFLQITISDTGGGISPRDLKNIFMPFFSTKKDGTGLDLSICYNIIRNHNGSIDLDSEFGKGTKFIIKLPFA